MKALAKLAVAATTLISSPTFADPGTHLTGRASIMDGDTIEIHGTRIRLWGIEPESAQLCRGDDSLQYQCGAKAANDLDAFIAARPVSCVPFNFDRYDRTVATCSVNGVDLARWLVSQGLTVDWPKYSRGDTSKPNMKLHKLEKAFGPVAILRLYRACVREGGSISMCSDEPRK